jgi:2,3-bisphosphoglycerate-independent phosphoglycerate mutase
MRFNTPKTIIKKSTLLGLVSDGGHPILPFTLTDRCYPGIRIKRSFVHASTDGRDVDPKSGKLHSHLENYIKHTSAK